MAEATQEQTGLGNYFIANYPPFSFWTPEHVPAAMAVLNEPPRPGVPLGLYLHIPFCRKRCKFCYFRVYTDKNARDVETYLNAIIKEVELYSLMPAVKERRLHFVYFGGGTPSYLSAAQLTHLISSIKKFIPWDGVDEVTFECEPGTLQQPKLAVLRELGVTRLSLGVENFDDRILEENGRAHHSAEIFRAYQWARDLHFDQINIDLIAGMVGETWDDWKDVVRKTIDMSADSVTIYQMELPFNTVYSKELRQKDEGGRMKDEKENGLPIHPSSFILHPSGIADWPTKRAWVEYAFDEMNKAGYEPSSGYTMVRDKQRTKFVYRDGLWHGADLLGTGVASFGHVSGVHMQNVDDWEHYVGTLEQGHLPLHRALPVQPNELLIRELILQLKTGRLEVPYFRQKFGVDILGAFQPAFAKHRDAGYLTFTPQQVTLTHSGLLQVDRLLPEFFLPEHRGARYT
jgi:coproporphyrinogen III oxidase-like Fe-S oxidoreductase